MLDPWIIEEIKRREKRRIEQPVVQIPAQGPPERDRDRGRKKDEEEKDPRGVEIIDFAVRAEYTW
jgi:hypothetical protein